MVGNSERNYEDPDVRLLEAIAQYMAPVLNELLQQRRRAAEKELLATQLRQGQRLESIGTLAGGIAHDFNNILSIMIGYTELLLLDATKDSNQRKNLESVLRGGLRGRDLVKQILTFSRQEPSETESVDVGSVAREAISFLRSSVPSTIEIRENIEADPGLVLGNPSQISQVLLNLGTNAVRAMRDTGGILEVEVARTQIGAADSVRWPHLSAGPHVKIAVKDTGIGMSQDVMEKMFDPFFTTMPPGEGTGMGLAVVHGVVKGHRGDMRCSSTPGKGTRFEVLLPLHWGGAPAEMEDEIKPAVPGQGRILIVDDEVGILDAQKQSLEHIGYQVEIRTSSIEALEALRERPDRFDLVVTDMTMPDMTGAELATRLLAIRADLPIILCTGYSEAINQEKAKEIGIREMLMKPVLVSTLTDAIRRALRGRRSQDNNGQSGS